MQETTVQARGCGPIEVQLVFDLHPDYNLAVRCLEYIRQRLDIIAPRYAHVEVFLISLCHHCATNCYPSLGMIGSDADLLALPNNALDDFSALIDAWVEAETLQSVILKSEGITAPTWAELSRGS